MSEPYAVRVTGGKKAYYRTKKDYKNGIRSSWGNGAKALKKSFSY